MRNVILASQSKQRQALLQGLGLKFTTVPSDLDEASVQHDDPLKRVVAVAAAKAKIVAEQFPDAIIIAADTYVLCEGQSLEKPQSLAEAKDMLRLQSGKAAQEITGMCYIDPSLSVYDTDVCVVEFAFRQLTESEIDAFVASQPVQSWSASFSPAYADGGLAFIASVNGSLTGFTHGLPIEWLVPRLQKSGVWK